MHSLSAITWKIQCTHSTGVCSSRYLFALWQKMKRDSDITMTVKNVKFRLVMKGPDPHYQSLGCGQTTPFPSCTGVQRDSWTSGVILHCHIGFVVKSRIWPIYKLHCPLRWSVLHWYCLLKCLYLLPWSISRPQLSGYVWFVYALLNW